jgi:glycosyltransferase involved in cell wall biosynthesis
MSTEEEIDGWRFFRAAMPRSAVRLPPGIGCAPLVSVLVGLNGMTVLGFVGSFYRYEGLDLLIDALKLLLPARRRTKLLLVRGGPDEVELKTALSSLGACSTARCNVTTISSTCSFIRGARCALRTW